MREKKPKKEKKQRIVYIDDGRTLADMSEVDKARGRDGIFGKSHRQDGRPTFRECLRTYFESVKLMVLPMLVTIGILSLAFLLFWLSASCAGA